MCSEVKPHAMAKPRSDSMSAIARLRNPRKGDPVAMVLCTLPDVQWARGHSDNADINAADVAANAAYQKSSTFNVEWCYRKANVARLCQRWQEDDTEDDNGDLVQLEENGLFARRNRTDSRDTAVRNRLSTDVPPRCLSAQALRALRNLHGATDLLQALTRRAIMPFKTRNEFDADCAAAVQRSNDPGLESLKQDARGVVGALKAIAAEKQEEALHRERKAGTIPMSAKRMDELVDRLEPLLADDEVVSEVIAMVQEEKGTDEPPDDFDPADVSCQTQWRMWYRLRQWEVQVRDRGLGAASGASPAHPQDGAGVPANEQPDAETGGGAAEMMPQDLVPFGEREDKSSGARSPAETDNDGGGWAAVMDEDKENSAGGWADVLGDNATPLRVDEEVSRYTTRLARTEGERKEARDKLSRERAQRAQDERQKEADLERLVTESSREHWWGVERDYQNIAHTSEGELNGVLNEWEFTTGMRIDSIQLNAGLSLVEPSPAYTEATRPPPLSVVTCPSPAYGDQVTSSSYIALSPYFGGATPNAAKKLVSPAANPIVDPTLPPELSLAPTSPNLRDKP
ncbi:hypothetical protein DIPPA_14998 [Diplonema papillatum]|nr:hypothetical protein DIPPA_14998 [Diplonema papillatum]